MAAGRQIGRYIAGLCVVMALFCVLDYLGVFALFNNYLYDLAFRIRGAKNTSERILLVVINDESLERYGRWPIPRRYYAELLDRLNGADVVGFDIIMAEPTDEDSMLADAVNRQGHVVLPVLFSGKLSALYPASGITGARVGHVHLETGIDGVVREMRNRLFGPDAELHSFAAAIYEIATNTTLDLDKNLAASRRPASIIQTNPMLINYRGGPGTYVQIPIQDVLDGRYAPSSFAGKIVIVGVTAAGLGSEVRTPFFARRQLMSSAEVQANAVNTLLSRDAIRPVPAWGLRSAAFLLALLCFALLVRLSERTASWVAAGAVLLVTIVVFLFFSSVSVWVSPVLLYIAICTAFLASYIFVYENSVRSLDSACDALVRHLRWHSQALHAEGSKRGIGGMLTRSGIQEKLSVMTAVTDQLLLEKELADLALFTETHGVLLFGPDRQRLFANERAMTIGAGNDFNTLSMDAFITSLYPFITVERKEDIVVDIRSGKWKNQALSVALPLPRRNFFTVDLTKLDAGGREFYLAVFSDITEVKEREILKTNIISTVSHEIKTPMTSIQGFSEMLAGKLDGRLKHYAEVIYSEARSLVRFLDTFLDIARIEQGRQPFTISVVSLENIINEAVMALKPIAAAKSITLSVEMPVAESLAFLDRDITRQGLLNLIENAIKYSPPESRIVVTLEDNPDHVKIHVTDQGYGIAADNLDRIFDMFYRIPGKGGEDVRGAGLGLTFVKEIVEAQGGALLVTSEIGKGSTFTMRFPKKKPAAVNK
ncbi:MAG TPA: CHASE2 domain-containing protein [Dissulfurispiraceae bacterium]|nr:CHASE2 domain-containing protein [Dissulfurispiraceae bacterium]